MKILFLTLKLPHAEVVGGNRIVFQRIRYLAEQGHQVDLMSYVTNETPAQLERMKKHVTNLQTLPLPHRNILFRVLHDYLGAPSRPALIWKVYSRDMMQAVANMVEEHRYDVVIAEFSEMGQFLYKNPYLSAVHTVISCHRCITDSYEKYREMKEVRWRLHLKSLPQLHQLRHYEFDMYRSADRTLVQTPQDRFTMQYYAPDLAISVSPSGVDIEELQKKSTLTREPIILMTGYMQDPANEDSVKWFVHHIWPALREHHPELKFYIVGADPSALIKRLTEEDDRIVVTGKVDDLRPYRNLASMLVSPVRLGSGMRTKVLEAMASGLPVVSTSLGMQGIEAQTGVNCLIADTADQFERSVEWLLEDPALGKQMADKAQELIEEKYTLESGLRHFEKILQSVVEG